MICYESMTQAVIMVGNPNSLQTLTVLVIIEGVQEYANQVGFCALQTPRFLGFSGDDRHAISNVLNYRWYTKSMFSRRMERCAF
jgi:hypothetical protein